jgi:excisionase family DNA binding protein
MRGPSAASRRVYEIARNGCTESAGTGVRKPPESSLSGPRWQCRRRPYRIGPATNDKATTASSRGCTGSGTHVLRDEPRGKSELDPPSLPHDDLEPLRLTLSIAEAASALGIGRTKMCELVSRGEVPTITIGRRKLIPVEALRRWVTEAPGPGRRNASLVGSVPPDSPIIGSVETRR